MSDACGLWYMMMDKENKQKGRCIYCGKVFFSDKNHPWQRSCGGKECIAEANKKAKMKYVTEKRKEYNEYHRLYYHRKVKKQ